jgi:translation elongation factor EF-1beta
MGGYQAGSGLRRLRAAIRVRDYEGRMERAEATIGVIGE